MVVSTPRTEQTEERLKRRLGFWGLTAIGFSNIGGSPGWLFAALYAAQTAGPAACDGGARRLAAGGRRHGALARNGVLLRSFAEVEPRSGIPRKALLLNLAVIVVFLLPYSGWQDVVSVVGDLYLLTYAAVAVSAAAFLVPGGRSVSGLVPGLRYIAPVSFMVATEFVYWSGWTHLRIALPLILIGVPLFLLAWRRHPSDALTVELRRGAWVVVYLVVLLVVSALGSFDGSVTIGAPWDTVLVGVLAVFVYVDAVRSSRRYIAT